MKTNFLPPELRPGDTVGLVQPSGQISHERYQAACQRIEALGYRIYHLPEMPRRHGYLGGTDQQRAHELHHMFAQPEVKAVWCIRGGYGTQRILPLLDTELIARNPKPFIGFSDITALANYITQRTGMITYHGIMGVSAFTEYDKQAFAQVVTSHRRGFCLSPLVVHAEDPNPDYHPYVITPGKAEGILVGGNLALLSSVVGTPYDVDYRGKILFLEDIDEAPYRIDRMLTQLLNAGKLQQVAGIALGIFAQCSPDDHRTPTDESLSLRQVLTDRLAPLGVPTMYGLPFGHIRHNATLPIGGQALLHADGMTLELL